MREGDWGDLFYIIKDGSVRVTQRNKEIRKMFKGEFFGDQALLYNCERTATVTAITEVVCLSLSRDHLTEIFGNKFAQILYKNSIRIALERSKTLKNLHAKQFSALADNISV
jgi:cGMP-dependent protein kinase